MLPHMYVYKQIITALTNEERSANLRIKLKNVTYINCSYRFLVNITKNNLNSLRVKQTGKTPAEDMDVPSTGTQIPIDNRPTCSTCSTNRYYPPVWRRFMCYHLVVIKM